MIFRSVNLFRKGRLELADLTVREGKIEAILAPNEAVPKADEKVLVPEAMILAPGLTDMHCHGAMGGDFSDADPEAWESFLAYEASVGVTQLCATTMTLPIVKLRTMLDLVRDYAPDNEQTANLVGVHLEGPFLSSQFPGCQNPMDLRSPDLDHLEELLDQAGGKVKSLTLAPELPNALDVIKELSDRCLISLGHTAADYSTAVKAFQAGASHLTHLFNAMTGWHHREPALLGAAFDNPKVTVELIADGIHLHPSTIRLAFKLFPGRIALISDSMRACGLADGNYEFGGQIVSKKGNEARLKDGQLAGSVTHLADGLRTAVKAGIPLETALQACTETPARLLGIDHEIGVIEVGRVANLILLDERDLSLKQVYLQGKAL